MSRSEIDQLQGLIAGLRKRVMELERIVSPVESGRTRPTGAARIVRLNGATFPSPIPAGEPGVWWDGIDQLIGSTGTEDGTSQTVALRRSEHSSSLGSWAQDVLVISLGQFELIAPSPGQLVPVIITSLSSGTFGPAAKLADVLAGGTTGKGTELPVLTTNPVSAFHSSAYPFAVDDVLPALHVYPTTDAAGASTVVGVDKDEGIFIVFTEPPSAEVKTFSDAVVLASGETLTYKVKTDSMGRVTSVEFTNT